jgi:hypothetical protein
MEDLGSAMPPPAGRYFVEYSSTWPADFKDALLNAREWGPGQPPFVCFKRQQGFWS